MRYRDLFSAVLSLPPLLSPFPLSRAVSNSKVFIICYYDTVVQIGGQEIKGRKKGHGSTISLSFEQNKQSPSLRQPGSCHLLHMCARQTTPKARRKETKKKASNIPIYPPYLLVRSKTRVLKTSKPKILPTPARQTFSPPTFSHPSSDLTRPADCKLTRSDRYDRHA